MGGVEVYTGFSGGKREGRRPLGRRCCRMDSSIEMNIQEVEGGALTGLIRV